MTTTPLLLLRCTFYATTTAPIDLGALCRRKGLMITTPSPYVSTNNYIRTGYLLIYRDRVIVKGVRTIAEADDAVHALDADLPVRPFLSDRVTYETYLAPMVWAKLKKRAHHTYGRCLFHVRMPDKERTVQHVVFADGRIVITDALDEETARASLEAMATIYHSCEE